MKRELKKLEIDNHKLHACKRKRVYETEDEAKRAAKAMRKKIGSKFHAYKCRYNDHYHVATTRIKHIRRLQKNGIMLEKGE